jgi:hypothetical protein
MSAGAVHGESGCVCINYMRSFTRRGEDKYIRCTFWVANLDRVIELGISCLPQSNWDLSSVVQLCGLSLPPTFIPEVERLYIQRSRSIQLPGWHWQKTSQ